MTRKLLALGLLLIAFAMFEYFFSPRPLANPQTESLAARLLPTTMGSFRSTKRWRQALSFHALEVGASYRDAGGAEANLDVWLGEWTPHNGIDCWYVRGYTVLWERLLPTRIANTRGVFDTALFRDDKGLALLASTQCYPTGCYESLVGPVPIPGRFGLQMPTFFEFGAAPTPISIIVRELSDPVESQAMQEARLVQSFERFTAQLDLTALMAPAVAQGAN